MILFLLIFSMTLVEARMVVLKDNILFGFEKCKSLDVDLQTGLLKELVMPSFDVHCRKKSEEKHSLSCDFFEIGSNKKIKTQEFSGGTQLGEGILVSKEQDEIKFLIGKNHASFKNFKNHQVCIGIFIFEKEALNSKPK